MAANVPFFLSLLFLIITSWTLRYIMKLVKSSEQFQAKIKIITLFMLLYLIIQGLLAYFNFYSEHTKSTPPMFILVVLPPIILILYLFNSLEGKKFIDSLSLLDITYFNIIRIMVELILMCLFTYKLIPQLMTFTGRNFDILAGLTAPLIAYFGIQKNKLSTKVILIWNFLSLALLLNIVVNAVLAAPFSFQQFAFDQPNIAVLYFPFVYLPGFIVPVVLFGHLVSIRRIIVLKRL